MRGRGRRPKPPQLLANEQLEPRRLMAVTPQEQLFIYELNRARHDPVAYQKEQKLPVDLAYVAAKPPLAVNAALTNSAEFKSLEMATHNYAWHQSGVTGKWPNQLVREYGYPLPANLRNDSNQVESICGGTDTNTAIAALNMLIVDAGTYPPGHRNHLLSIDNDNREIGVGYATKASSQYTNYWTVHSTQDGAGSPFLTGVVYNDTNGNSRYDANEGISNATVTVGSVRTVSTNEAGGWSARVPDGDYFVTVSGTGFTGAASMPVRVRGKNVELDFVSGRKTGWIDFAEYRNTAPVLDTAPTQTGSPVFSGQGNPAGMTVDAFLAGAVTDPDVLSVAGVAVVAASSTASGQWQFSRDGGTSWTMFGTPTEAAARLLLRQDRVRFLPSSGSTGTASISYRAWDLTAGTAGQTADATAAVSGGTSAFSAKVETAVVSVLSGNRSPTLAANGTRPLDDVLEDDASSIGTRVEKIVGSAMSDADQGTRPGIAVVGATGTSNGTWQYSVDAGSSWVPLEDATATRAILLGAGDRLRFVPRKDFNGPTAATITYRAWDQSSGSPGQMVNLSAPASVGGGTAFSSETAVTSAGVLPANDAPVVVAGAAAFRLDPIPINSSRNNFRTTAVSKLLGNGFRDVDGTGKRGIAIIGFGGNGQLFFGNSDGFQGNTALPSPDAAWLLKSEDTLLVEPSGGFSGTTTVTFRLWDQSQGKPGFGGAVLVGPDSVGGTTAFSADVVTATIYVGAAGPAPVATLGTPVSAPGGGQSSIAVTFSADVAGVDTGDFVLTRDGVPVSLDDAVLSGSGRSYSLANLSSATLAGGSYTLRFVAGGSGVADALGKAPGGDAQVAWISKSVPPTPTNLSATAGSGQVALTWSAPAGNGGSPIIDYRVQFSDDGGTAWKTFDHPRSTATSLTVTGLVNGRAHLFRVAAVNDAGPGGDVQSLPVIPRSTPSAPAGLSATPDDRAATISWTTPVDGGSVITEYVVQRSTDGGAVWGRVNDPGFTATSITVRGLVNGTRCLFRVAAVNILGTGPFSPSVAVVPATVPDAPSGLSARPGDAEVTLTWNAPATDGGSQVSDYFVLVSDDGGEQWSVFDHVPSATTSLKVTGLANGQSHLFQVAAMNAVGTGAFARSSPVTPVALPAAPLNLQAIPGDRQATLSWTATTSPGNPVSDYAVHMSTDGGKSWTSVTRPPSTATSMTVGQLNNGTTYFFRVAAVSAAGAGKLSQPVTVVPRTVPAAPGGLIARPDDARVLVSWTAPNNGGSPISDYVVQYSTNGGSEWITVPHPRSTATSLMVPSLANGRSHLFRVAALNAAGQGAFVQSGPVIPGLPPGAPLDLIGSPGDGRSTLSWKPPASTGNLPITDYLVQYSTNGGSTWITFPHQPSAATSIAVTGLVNGQSHVFRVAALNAVGAGGFVTAAAVVPCKVPGAPTQIAATPGNGSVTLTWTAPSSNGGSQITDYLVQWSANGGNAWTTVSRPPAVGTNVTMSGLSNGTGYLFRVAGINSAGIGAASTATSAVTPLASPCLAPTAKPGDGAISLSWDPPSGVAKASITDYVVRFSADGGRTWTTAADGVSAATLASVTVTNGIKHVFQVAPVVSGGLGPFSAASVAVAGYSRSVLPDVPLSVKAVGSRGTVTLTWLPPPQNGGGPVVDYVIQLGTGLPGAAWFTLRDGTSTATTATFRLVPGQRYAFRVAARNLAGTGVFSAPTDRITA